jgi:hypothetical protein
VAARAARRFRRTYSVQFCRKLFVRRNKKRLFSLKTSLFAGSSCYISSIADEDDGTIMQTCCRDSRIHCR